MGKENPARKTPSIINPPLTNTYVWCTDPILSITVLFACSYFGLGCCGCLDVPHRISIGFLTRTLLLLLCYIVSQCNFIGYRLYCTLLYIEYHQTA
jgi:hypothetical protein